MLEVAREKPATRIGRQTNAREPHRMAVVVVSVVALLVCVAALVEQANRQRIRLRLERQWAWSVSHQPVPIQDRDFEVYVGCLWVEAGPVRLRWPERVVKGPAMTAQQEWVLKRAVDHLERMELLEAEARLKEYGGMGYVVSRSQWEAARIGARISATRGDYVEAIIRRQSPARIKGIPISSNLGLYTRSNWRTGDTKRDVSAWSDAALGRVRAPYIEFDADRLLTQGELFLRNGRRVEALRFFRRAASLDPNGRPPAPAGMARAWLRKLNAFP